MQDLTPFRQAVPSRDAAAGERGPAAVWAVGLAKSCGQTVALHGLDLHVAAGETVAPLGAERGRENYRDRLAAGPAGPGRGPGPGWVRHACEFDACAG